MGFSQMTTTRHLPVLRKEVIDALAPEAGDIFVDGTSGGGGHTRALAEAVTEQGLVIGIDRDAAALERAESQLRGLPVKLAQANYADLPELLAQLEITGVDGILLDLGLSSDQLGDASRGFSFSADGPLDLRFDLQAGQPAWRLLKRISERQLADLIYRYGEERYSRRIARRIVQQRAKHPIRTATDLARLVRSCLPAPKTRHRIDPATRTFQALRIAVNEELKWLEVALSRLPACLHPGGRLAVISFHSLEDRLVKSALRDDPRLEVLTPKPIGPAADELAMNPRSRSAKLRVARRLDP
jgi:16S rRNA (cytosine1402-N4)-methyltransferase